MHLSFTAMALYLSMHDTGALVTPYEAQQIRAEAVARCGYDRLRAKSLKRAAFCAAEPDAHSDRFEWAEAAAAFVEEPYETP
ncbi:hypothetical protein [Kitasatospora purpeofusca]|uniref:hypothetical protein n=1 Tax=Kitasatospora purpeofusca TaxID=67352 RepID=UPI0035D89120